MNTDAGGGLAMDELQQAERLLTEAETLIDRLDQLRLAATDDTEKRRIRRIWRKAIVRMRRRLNRWAALGGFECLV